MLLALLLVSAFMLASPADAKTRKHKKITTYSKTAYGPQDRGTNLVRPSISAMIPIRISAF